MISKKKPTKRRKKTAADEVELNRLCYLLRTAFQFVAMSATLIIAVHILSH